MAKTYFDYVKTMTEEEFADWLLEVTSEGWADTTFCRTICEHRTEDGCALEEYCNWISKPREVIMRILQQPVEVPDAGEKADGKE